MKILYWIILAAIVIGLGSCVTSKSLAKKANAMESGQNYEAAADLFFQSVQKDPQNVEAVSGMKRTGTQVLNSKLADFSKAKLDQDYKTATYKFLEAKAYKNKIKTVNVDLAIPEFYEQDYDMVLESYLDQEYSKGLELIEKEDFGGAEQHFNEVFKFNQTYKDVKELRNIAYLEPIYRNAESSRTAARYRDAYDQYQTILKRVNVYKDTREKQTLVLEKGRKNLIFMSSQGKTKYGAYDVNIKSYTTNALLGMNDPFIKLVDRENLDKIIKEQELAVSGIASDKGAVELGEIASANFAIQLEMTNYIVDEKPMTKQSNKGYEQYTVKVPNTNPQMYETKYKSVNYITYLASRSVSYTVHFKLVSIKTGEILTSQMIEKQSNSQVNYLNYDGNIKALYPDNNGQVNINQQAHEQLVKMSQAPRELETKESLEKRLYDIVSKDVSQNILQYFKNNQ
jgi:hypothetical protein